MTDIPDTVLRAITDDGAFRVITLRSTETVKAAIAAQKATGTVARTFADFVTGTVLVRETMAPDQRVQGILQASDKQSRMIVDTHPGGATRGLVQMGKGVKDVPVGAGALLQMVRTLFNGSLQQGVVAVPETGGISGAIMQYMQSSEQVVSMLAVGCHMRGEEVIAAGGYLVQLLPEVHEPPLAIMAERLKDFENVDAILEAGAADPAHLLSEILYGMPYTEVGRDPVAFGCQCSVERLAASLATLPKHEIESFIADGKLLEIQCDYCGKDYEIAPELLRGLTMAN